MGLDGRAWYLPHPFRLLRDMGGKSSLKIARRQSSAMEIERLTCGAFFIIFGMLF